MRHVVKVQSKFDKGILKDFKVLSVEPPFTDNRTAWETQRVAVYNDYTLYMLSEKHDASVLWLWKEYKKPASYLIEDKITHQQYIRSLEVWNKAYGDITVIDVGEKLLGEME